MVPKALHVKRTQMHTNARTHTRRPPLRANDYLLDESRDNSLALGDNTHPITYPLPPSARSVMTSGPRLRWTARREDADSGLRFVSASPKEFRFQRRPKESKTMLGIAKI